MKIDSSAKKEMQKLDRKGKNEETSSSSSSSSSAKKTKMLWYLPMTAERLNPKKKALATKQLKVLIINEKW